MIKPTPQTSKLLTTLVLTLFILSAFVISGFTVASFNAQTDQELPPNQGPVVHQIRHLSGDTAPGVPNKEGGVQPALPDSGSDEPATPEPAQPSFKLTNVIKNGDFEKNPRSSVATYWEPYHNGGAVYGWYAERWVEAVHSGKHAQLMEIHQVDTYQPDRIIAIYQTVEVVPNANYNLTIHALMRSDAPPELRNQGEYAMQWGIDYQGRGKHYNVQTWYTMPLTEQLRIGSGGPPADAQHLFYQRVTRTIFTTDTNKITLFIRGVKIEPTGTELDFNVDDVSLIGPYFPPPPVPVEQITPTATISVPTTVTPTATPVTEATATPASDEQPATPTSEESSLPDAGAILPRNISAGALTLGGLVLIVLGVGAANGLLKNPKNAKKIGQK